MDIYFNNQNMTIAEQIAIMLYIDARGHLKPRICFQRAVEFVSALEAHRRCPAAVDEIDTLRMPVRLRKALKRDLKISSLSDLIGVTRASLLSLRNFGRTTMRNLEELLADNGMGFTDESIYGTIEFEQNITKSVEP